MAKTHQSPRTVWEFEKFLASKPHVWLVEAYNLKLACETLCRQDREITDCIFNKKIAPPSPPFFSARIARMLMGFSLENLFKAMALQDPDKFRQAFSKDGGLSWGKDGHNLINQTKNLNFQLSDLEFRYLELWEMCAIWAGRYPIAMNEHNLPKHRVGVPTLAESVERAKQRAIKAIKESDPLMGAELSDLLHSGINDLELDTFLNLFDRCIVLLPKTE